MHLPTTTIEAKAPSQTDVLRHLIVDLLEEDSGEDLSPLRGVIDSDVESDAVDSLRIISIVLEIERRLGILIDNDELTRDRVRSLTRFAEFIGGKMIEQGGKAGGK